MKRGMRRFADVRGAMTELGDEVQNLHFWSCHAEVLNVADCLTDLSDVETLRADSEAAVAWLEKYADESELMSSMRSIRKRLQVGHEYQSDDGDWSFWIDCGEIGGKRE